MFRPRTKRMITRVIPQTLRPRWRRSYSQEGEDLVLANMFGDDYRGIYVDIGAHDPYAWSNTKKLVDRGWRGLNIDPLPGAAERFRRHRPRDSFMEAAIDIGLGQEIRYWIFEQEPRWNCLSYTEPFVEKDGAVIRPTASRTVPVVSIEDAVRKQGFAQVDLINLDIEGGEEYILRNWPWDRYAPKVICVELVGMPAAEIADSPLTRFMASKQMVFTSQLLCSVIYVDRAFLPRLYPADTNHAHFRRLAAFTPAR